MKYRLPLIVSVILCSLLLASCKQANGTITANYISTTPTNSAKENDTSQSPVEDTTANEKSDDTNNYSIVDDVFIEKKVSIKYPQLTGLSDNVTQNSINNLLKSEAMDGFEYYDNDSTDLDLSIDYEITWMSENLLSVKYSGSGYGGGAAHTNNLLYTVNINIKNGSKVKLGDYLNIDKNFVEKYMNYREPEESMVNYALEDMLSETSVDQYLDDFCVSDSEYDYDRAIFSYFTEDALGICIEVSDIFGGNVDIKIKYMDLKENIKTDSEVWTDFSSYLK